MANELQILGDPVADTGKTITCKVYNSAGTQVGGTISCPEQGTLAWYRGNMPTATAGEYLLHFYEGAAFLSAATFFWTGSIEPNILSLLMPRLEVG